MRVLVAEDEAYLAEAIQVVLTRECMAVDVVHDGDAALESLAVNDYDVVILDRDLPGTHGDEVCRVTVADGSGVFVLMLTASGGLRDKVAGFELGADDYLSKPFEFAELVARLRSAHRRSREARPPVLESGGVKLDPFRREVYSDGRFVRLSRKEFAVLAVLMSSEGGVISAERLLEKAWDSNADPFTNSVRVTLSTLRRKLGKPQVIETVAGSGYRFVGHRSAT
ncbi:MULTISPECIES: response regulator transcription factor [unclassified Frondihabitans]|uniref:response regulator transcription factor n=1 Tax=unclassified Frondihabitans TaxID=2626248 RepID=UPI000F50E8B0|nr:MULTISPECIES: response regulator transcription factor [unclassified Frondihabitans]RPE76120.1 two-component system response regulator VanR [Frondihabitans sp. PhB153]RPF05604.1 two-component system response regulator VanR [Frondihabitans sp. PhB161]